MKITYVLSEQCGGYREQVNSVWYQCTYSSIFIESTFQQQPSVYGFLIFQRGLLNTWFVPPIKPSAYWESLLYLLCIVEKDLFYKRI